MVLGVGTVPGNIVLDIGTVSGNVVKDVGTVSGKMCLNVGTVPANKRLILIRLRWQRIFSFSERRARDF